MNIIILVSRHLKFRNSVAIVLIMVPPSLLVIIIKIIARVRIIAMETNESENESMTVDDHAEAGIDSASSGRVRPFSDATVAALRAYHKKGMVGIGRNYSGVINPRPEGYGTCSVINPRPEGYGSRFVILSIYLSVNSATENSAHFFVPVKVRTG